MGDYVKERQLLTDHQKQNELRKWWKETKKNESAEPLKDWTVDYFGRWSVHSNPASPSEWQEMEPAGPDHQQSTKATANCESQKQLTPRLQIINIDGKQYWGEHTTLPNPVRNRKAVWKWILPHDSHALLLIPEQKEQTRWTEMPLSSSLVNRIPRFTKSKAL